MRYRFEEERGIPVAQLRGAVTEGPDGSQFFDAIRRHCVQGRVRFVVDCAGITRITPPGLGVLITALATARNVGGTLVLARVPGPLRSLLMITDLQSVFACYPTVEAAVEAVRAPRS
jgi:anti-anti-sigma factor